MTTEQLEELAAKCAVAIDGVGRNASYGLSDSDLRDLARCARAWAKVRRSGEGGWLFMVDQYYGASMDSGFTQDGYECPIEAVEAAEVKP